MTQCRSQSTRAIGIFMAPLHLLNLMNILVPELNLVSLRIGLEKILAIRLNYIRGVREI